MQSEAAARRTLGSEGSPPPAAWWIALLLGSFVLGLAVYYPALQGPYISDDFGYLTSPYTASLDAASLIGMFDPAGDARLYTGNYAPIHLLLHALERALFGQSAVGYHVVNVAFHALNAVLLVALLLSSGAARNAALLGGLVFAVHPANVEAVAWISQLKSTAALAFALLALLALKQRPVWAALAFSLALLTKATAVFALPAAIAFVWVQPAERRTRRAWIGVGAWCAIFALFAIPQFSSFARIGSVEVPAFADPTVQLRTVAAMGARYLAMAGTGVGVSAFAEPPPVESWLDRWWLAAIPLGLALAARTIFALVHRKPEAPWWVAAAAAFVPVSQIFPFLIPFADRYLYFIFPGLIGGVVCAGMDLATPRLGTSTLGRGAAWAGAAFVVAMSALFASMSYERAALWQSENALLVDAALHYPDGATAHYLRARRAASQRDVDAAVASLRLASEKGLDRFETLRRDPAFAPIQQHADFRALIFEMAGRWIERARIGEESTQPELLAVARAHRVREQWCEAQVMLTMAEARGGPLGAAVAAERASLLEQVPQPCDGTRRGDGHR